MRLIKSSSFYLFLSASLADDLLIETRTQANDTMYMDHELKRLGSEVTTSGLGGLLGLTGLQTNAHLGLSPLPPPANDPKIELNLNPTPVLTSHLLSQLSKPNLGSSRLDALAGASSLARATATLPRKQPETIEELIKKHLAKKSSSAAATAQNISKSPYLKDISDLPTGANIFDSLNLEASPLSRDANSVNLAKPAAAAAASRSQTIREGLELAGVASQSLLEELGLTEDAPRPRPTPASSARVPFKGVIDDNTLKELGLGHLVRERYQTDPTAAILAGGIAARRGQKVAGLPKLAKGAMLPSPESRRGSLDTLLTEQRKTSIKPLLGLQTAGNNYLE